MFIPGTPILMAYLNDMYGEGGMKKQDGIPSDASTEAKEHTDNFAEDRGSYWFSREQFLEMYNKHYRRHPLRKLFKRRYVEKPLDVMKYFFTEDFAAATLRLIAYMEF